jgi:hypothetical protein
VTATGTITQDATSGQFFPANTLEWYELLNGQSPALPFSSSSRTVAWPCQEASGSLLIESRSEISPTTFEDLPALGTVSYGNAVTGYTRKAVHVSAFTSCGFGVTSGTAIQATRLGVLMCIKLGATESGTTNRIFAWAISDGGGTGTFVASQGIDITCDSTGKITLSGRLGTATSVSSYSGTTDPIWLFLHYPAGNGGAGLYLRIYNKAGTVQETLTPSNSNVNVSVSDMYFGDGMTTAQSADLTVLYATCFYQLNGDITTTMADNIMSAIQNGPVTAVKSPGIVGIGAAATAAAGTVAPAWPAGHQAGDLGVLIVETANQAVATPSTWTAFPSGSQGTGTAGAAGASRIQVFYKYAASSSESAPTVANSGNHDIGQIIAFRRVASGTPYDVTAGAVTAAATNPLTLPSITTTKINDLILSIVSCSTSGTLEGPNHWLDSSSTMSGFGGPAAFFQSTVGVGGGYSVAVGVSLTAQTLSNTQINDGTTANGAVVIALGPSLPALDDGGGGTFEPPPIAGIAFTPSSSAGATDVAMSPAGLDDGYCSTPPPIVWSTPPPVAFVESASGDDYVVVLDDGTGPSEPPPIDPGPPTWLEAMRPMQFDGPDGYYGGHPPIGSPLVGPSKKKFATVKGRNK